jgi:hypothetical protein
VDPISIPETTVIGKQIDLAIGLTNSTNGIQTKDQIETGAVIIDSNGMYCDCDELETVLEVDKVLLTLYIRPKQGKYLSNYPLSHIPRPIGTTQYSSLVISRDDFVDNDFNNQHNNIIQWKSNPKWPFSDGTQSQGQIEGLHFSGPQPETNPIDTLLNPSPLRPEDNCGWYTLRHGYDYEMDWAQIQESLPLSHLEQSSIELFFTPDFSLNTLPELLHYANSYLDKSYFTIVDNDGDRFDGSYCGSDGDLDSGLFDQNSQFPRTQFASVHQNDLSPHCAPQNHTCGEFTNPFCHDNSQIEFEFYLDIQFMNVSKYGVDFQHDGYNNNDAVFNGLGIDGFGNLSHFQTSLKWSTTFGPAIVIDNLHMGDPLLFRNYRIDGLGGSSNLSGIDPNSTLEEFLLKIQNNPSCHTQSNESNPPIMTFIASISNHTSNYLELNPGSEDNGNECCIYLLTSESVLPPESTCNVICSFPVFQFDHPSFQNNPTSSDNSHFLVDPNQSHNPILTLVWVY